VWNKAANNGTFGLWTSLGGQVTSGPGAASWGNGRTDVFARGRDGALWGNAFVTDHWPGWYSLGGQLTSSPDVASWGVDRLDVFALGTNSGMWHRAWTGTAWAPSESLGGRFTWSRQCRRQRQPHRCIHPWYRPCAVGEHLHRRGVERKVHARRAPRVGSRRRVEGIGDRGRLRPWHRRRAVATLDRRYDVVGVNAGVVTYSRRSLARTRRAECMARRLAARRQDVLATVGHPCCSNASIVEIGEGRLPHVRWTP
jgi:hypothetical protein